MDAMDIRVKCASCKKEFRRPLGRVNEAHKFGWKQYCSKACMVNSMIRSKKLQCGNPDCKKQIYRSPHETRKVTRSFCSRSCAAHINNRKFPKRGPGFRICAGVECGNHVTGWVKYCSSECRQIARRADPDELVTKLKLLAAQLGRTPAKREAGGIAEACIYAFGSWNIAVNKARLTPHRSHSQRMYKRTSTVAVDGHTCDSISEAIVDNWLTTNNISHLRNASYPGTKHKADWVTKKNVFIEYFGLANDSPRYDQSIQEKRKLCDRYNIQLIEIYPADIYPVIRLGNKFKPLL